MNERDEVRLRDMLDEARRARRFVQGKTRADLDAGIVLAFRRAECRYKGLILGIYGIDPAATYDVESIDGDGKVIKTTISGAELGDGLELRVDTPGSTRLVRYRKADKQ